MGFLVRSSHSFYEEFVTYVFCSLYHKANWQHLQDGPSNQIEFRPILSGSTARYKHGFGSQFAMVLLAKEPWAKVQQLFA